MNQATQEENSVYSVEFYPTVEDYVYIATRIGESVGVGSVAVYSYQVFLFLNTIVFPAFLWINDYFALGLAVLAINIVAVVLIGPRMNSHSYRQYYQHLFGERELKIARVSLNGEGATYESDGELSFWPWRRIELVEDTGDSIYFFHGGNGFAVRKSGFPYPEDANKFIEYSRQNVQLARPQLTA